MSPPDTIRLAGVGDLHCTERSHGMFQPLFREASRVADILLLLGDLTDYGREDEARVLANELRAATIPMFAVLGNHDYESERQQEIKRILADVGVTVLDGSAHVHGKVGFAGTKGFVGGFGRRALAPWGEPSIKRLVQEGVDESLKLESALARLWTDVKVVLLHYAPIQATVHGEPLEIMPFLGSSRLEEMVDRYRANVVFHGHAHRGSPLGHTKANIPVHNVAMPLLLRQQPGCAPFKLVELPLTPRVQPGARNAVPSSAQPVVVQGQVEPAAPVAGELREGA